MKKLIDLTIEFCVITTFITILSAVLGSLLLPGTAFGYGAFFYPPLFGLASAVITHVTRSDKAVSRARLLFSQFMQLLLIELMVFGVNYLAGADYSFDLGVSLAFGIAFIYVLIGIILWCNDKKNAEDFNRSLKAFQEQAEDAAEE